MLSINNRCALGVFGLAAILFFVLEFQVACSRTSGDPEMVARLDASLTQIIGELNTVPGLAVAVVQDSAVVYLRGFGYRDVEAKLPVTPQTTFYIASSTKSFTGLLAALLAYEGKLDLDAPMSLYLPEARLPAPLSPDAVTVRELLTHTFGFENEPIVTRTAYTGQYTPELLVRLLEHSTPNEFGKAFSYSNLGYVLTSLIIDRLENRSWKDILSQKVLQPLGMKHTTSYVSKATEWPLAVPYFRRVERERLPFAKKDNTMHAAGGLLSTAEDLANWLLVNINNGRLEGRQVFPAAVMHRVHRQQTSLDQQFYRFHRFGYGVGWYLADYEGDTLYHHFGSFSGFRAHISFMPASRIGVAVLMNELSYAGTFENALFGQMEIRVANNHLTATLGNLSSAMEPYDGKNALRVELIPGRGQIVRFSVGTSGRADSLQYRDAVWKRHRSR